MSELLEEIRAILDRWEETDIFKILDRKSKEIAEDLRRAERMMKGE